MARRKLNRPSRHGQIPTGWEKMGIQLPTEFVSQWEAATPEVGDVKLLGTAAIALVLSLDTDTRHALMKVVHDGSWPGPPTVKPEQVWDRFLELMAARSA